MLHIIIAVLAYFAHLWHAPILTDGRAYWVQAHDVVIGYFGHAGNWSSYFNAQR